MKTPPSVQESLFASVFPRVLSRAEKRQIQILEGAIHCFASEGIENSTYEAIGAKCKTSRTLILHYFPNRDDLNRLVFLYIRADMQNVAVEAIRSARTPDSQLTQYIQSCFQWVDEKPKFWTVWILFYYYCAMKPQMKAMHTELTTMGHERIIALMGQLKENQAASKKDVSLRAKTIQALITGSLVSVHTETLTVSREAFVAQTLRDCLRIAKGR